MIELKNIDVTFQNGSHEFKAVDNVSLKINKGEIFGIVGPSGAGKSTIFRMIMKEQEPDGVSFEIGDTVKIAYVDQSHSNIDTEKSIWENFCDGKN